MHHVSFIESPDREKTERALFSATTGEQFDSVFIQVTYATYITPKFREWIEYSVVPRLGFSCDAIRIAVIPQIIN